MTQVLELRSQAQAYKQMKLLELLILFSKQDDKSAPKCPDIKGEEEGPAKGAEGGVQRGKETRKSRVSPELRDRGTSQKGTSAAVVSPGEQTGGAQRRHPLHLAAGRTQGPSMGCWLHGLHGRWVWDLQGPQAQMAPLLV